MMHRNLFAAAGLNNGTPPNTNYPPVYTGTYPPAGWTSSTYYGYVHDLNFAGDILLVGSPWDNAQLSTAEYRKGQVYAYIRNGSNWTYLTTVRPAGVLTQYQYGSSVAISNDGAHMIAGSPSWGYVSGQSSGRCGAAHFFSQSGGTFTELATFLPPNKNVIDVIYMGSSCAIAKVTGDYAFFGGDSSAESSSTPRYGAVYVYKRTGSTWAYETRLFDTLFTNVGGSVTCNGDGSIVAAGTNPLGGTASLVQIYQRSGTTWSKVINLASPDNGQSFGRYPCSVAMNDAGDLLAVGDITKAKVYTYRRLGSSWIGSDVITKPLSTPLSNFGYQVKLNSTGDVMLVGSEALSGNGCAWTFRLTGTGWVLEHTMTDPSPVGTGSGFGQGIGMSGGGVWYSVARVSTPGGLFPPGALYVYDR